MLLKFLCVRAFCLRFQSKRLTTDEVRNFITNETVLGMYNKSIRRNRNANAFIISGFVISAFGVYTLAYSPFHFKREGPDPDYGSSYLSSNYYYHYNLVPNFDIGLSTVIAGGTLLISGVALKIANIYLVRNIVDLLNGGTSAEAALPVA